MIHDMGSTLTIAEPSLAAGKQELLSESFIGMTLQSVEWGEIEKELDVEELSVSFGYHFRMSCDTDLKRQEESSSYETEVAKLQSSEPDAGKIARTDFSGGLKRARVGCGSFSCLSGAALGANATLANTGIGKGLIGEEILPGLDSPKTFRRLQPSVSFSKIESLMSGSPEESNSSDPTGKHVSTSAPQRIETRSFSHAADVQTAGGAAGEDRVQAVCSEEDGWLFCAIYDGFNGRDAADYLAGTLYENISFNLTHLECQMQLRRRGEDAAATSVCEEATVDTELRSSPEPNSTEILTTPCDFQQGVLKALKQALVQTESGFMDMVEQEMHDRPDLAMVGSCVLVVLLQGHDLYTLNLGDSRAVLATNRSVEKNDEEGNKALTCVQLTQDHVVEELSERQRVLAEHPDDDSVIVCERVKGKIKVTRAFGAGYLKQAKLNDALIGILRVQDLCSPPYLSAQPHVTAHTVSEEDEFVVIASDGLFDFFSNEEVVELIHRFMSENPNSDPAKYMLDQLLIRAAQNAGFTVEHLKNIPIGRRRKYHDDVTVMVVTLGPEHRTSQASTLS